jgi:hypothetical protein
MRYQHGKLVYKSAHTYSSGVSNLPQHEVEANGGRCHLRKSKVLKYLCFALVGCSDVMSRLRLEDLMYSYNKASKILLQAGNLRDSTQIPKLPSDIVRPDSVPVTTCLSSSLSVKDLRSSGYR